MENLPFVVLAVVVGLVSLYVIVVSLLQRHRYGRQVSSARLLDQLRKMEPYDFERLTAEVFRRHGYGSMTVGRTGDGGRDVIFVGEGTRNFVQCKRYEHTVGSGEVRDFYGAIVDSLEKGDKGYFVATAFFTKAAQEFVDGKPLVLVDARHLIRLVRSAGFGGGLPLEAGKIGQLDGGCPKCGRDLNFGRRSSREVWYCSVGKACGYLRVT